MSKLKEKVGSVYLTFRKSIEKFPLTIITIIILTLIYVINLEESLIQSNILKNITFFGFVFANGAFLTETISKKKSKKIVGYIISVVYASIFTYINAYPDVIIYQRFYTLYII